jgi:hypothetical protein
MFIFLVFLIHVIVQLFLFLFVCNFDYIPFSLLRWIYIFLDHIN